MGSTDALALRKGESTDKIAYMMRSDAEVDDPYALIGAPYANHVNLLVTSPAVCVLAQRSKHWKHVIAELKPAQDPWPFDLAKLQWNHIEHRCSPKSFSLPLAAIPESVVAPALEDLRKVLTMTATTSDPRTQQKYLLYSIFNHVLASTQPPVSVNPGYHLESNRHILDVAGTVDFLLVHGARSVCVMLPAGEFEDSDGEDYEMGDAAKSKRAMENGLAQVVMAMEIVHTYATRSAVGIVSNYQEWLFVETKFNPERDIFTVSTDVDILAQSINNEPTPADMARIAGKIASLIRSKEYGTKVIHERFYIYSTVVQVERGQWRTYNSS